MSETKETTTDKTLRSGSRKPLSLKRTEPSGHVQQSFSHGRKNVVVVERKKRRTISTPGQAEEEGHATDPVASRQGGATKGEATRQGALRPDELDARQKALAANREREAIEAQFRTKQEKERDEERRRLEAEAPPKEGADPQVAPDPVAADVAAAPQAGAPNEAVKGETPAKTPDPGAGVAARTELRKVETIVRKPGRPVADEAVADDDDLRGKKKGGVKVVKSPVKGPEERRERVKLTINNFDREAQERSLASLRRKRERDARRAMGTLQSREKIMR